MSFVFRVAVLMSRWSQHFKKVMRLAIMIIHLRVLQAKSNLLHRTNGLEFAMTEHDALKSRQDHKICPRNALDRT